MNALKILIAASLSLTALGAFAQEAGSDDWLQVQGSKTRVEVQAELAQARADGSLMAYGRGYVPSLSHSVSRADIVAALNASRASGEFDRVHAEAWQAGTPGLGLVHTHVAMSR